MMRCGLTSLRTPIPTCSRSSSMSRGTLGNLAEWCIGGRSHHVKTTPHRCSCTKAFERCGLALALRLKRVWIQNMRCSNENVPDHGVRKQFFRIDSVAWWWLSNSCTAYLSSFGRSVLSRPNADPSNCLNLERLLRSTRYAHVLHIPNAQLRRSAVSKTICK